MSAKKNPEFDEDAKRLYQQAVLQQSLEFDKQLVWLAGGAIALITTLTAALKPDLSGLPLIFAGIGLGLLLVSLATTLVSFQISISDSGAILSGQTDLARREKRMRLLNYASLTTFVLGVAAFLVFAYLVLSGGGTVTPNKKFENGMPAAVPTKTTTPAQPATPTPAPKPKK